MKLDQQPQYGVGLSLINGQNFIFLFFFLNFFLYKGVTKVIRFGSNRIECSTNKSATRHKRGTKITILHHDRRDITNHDHMLLKPNSSKINSNRLGIQPNHSMRNLVSCFLRRTHHMLVVVLGWPLENALAFLAIQHHNSQHYELE